MVNDRWDRLLALAERHSAMIEMLVQELKKPEEIAPNFGIGVAEHNESLSYRLLDRIEANTFIQNKCMQAGYEDLGENFLARMASRKIGPPFEKHGGKTWYDPYKIEEWISSPEGKRDILVRGRRKLLTRVNSTMSKSLRIVE
jgi:hypothetical protein